MDRQKLSSSIIIFLNFSFPNEHGKATKPPQKHTFHLHSDPTPQLCTCCSHLHSKDKLTSARSPKLRQPGGAPEKRGRMGNTPLTPPSAFPEAAGAPPRLCQWLDGSTTQPSRAVGTISTHRSTSATTQSSEIQKSTTHGGGEASKLKARPNSLLYQRARVSSSAAPSRQLSLYPVGAGALLQPLLTQLGTDHAPGELPALCQHSPPPWSRRERLCVPLVWRKTGGRKQQLPQAVMSIFALSCPLLSHGQQNKAHGPQTWRANWDSWDRSSDPPSPGCTH